MLSDWSEALVLLCSLTRAVCMSQHERSMFYFGRTCMQTPLGPSSFQVKTLGP